jgi:hypothetical protein
MVIAERRLVLAHNGRSSNVAIRIHAPEKKGSQWICRFEIGWPEETADRWGEGTDSMQALLIAVQMIGAEIYASRYHEAGQLSWLAEGRGYGFPVANMMRDLLVGDDKKFF